MLNSAEMPLVSVCIPTYNRAEKLARAVKSILASTYSNLEIVISDNASTDNTSAVCKDLAASDSRIVFHRHATNQGPTKNFNFARSVASGKYFLWHGDDDFVDLNYIERCVARLEQDSSLVLVSGLSSYDHGNGLKRFGNIIQLRSRSPLIRSIRYLWRVEDNSIFCGAYRRELLTDVSMPNTLAGDWVWMASVAFLGKVEVIPDTYVHRDHGDTTSSSNVRICQVLGLPAHQARWPRYFIAVNIAKLTVVTRSDGSQNSGAYVLAARALLLVTLVFKFIHQIIVSRMKIISKPKL